MKSVWLVPVLSVVLLLTPGCALWRAITQQGPATPKSETTPKPSLPEATVPDFSAPSSAEGGPPKPVPPPPAPSAPSDVTPLKPAPLPSAEGLSTPDPEPALPPPSGPALPPEEPILPPDVVEPLPPAESSPESISEPEPVAASGSAPETVPSESSPPPPPSFVPPPPPERLEMPVPVFPADFDWDLAIGGWVDLEITISKDGEVRDVVVLDSSAPELELPVVEALFEARYMSSGGEPRTFRERFSF